ncbi:MAG TPA: DUF1232 domain-containing protein [Enhygromyxa sp.]|nr:DUF1232 domain-containing protein [Enhygromyxa sp.]
MDTAHLHEQIETAVAIEAKAGHLANYLTDRAAERGVPLGDRQRREALELFEGYVRSVPELLTGAMASAAGTPVEATMAKVMAAAVAYWDEPDDLVPDQLGVLGLLDDAYFSLRMLQLVSERLRDESGQTLIADDLSALDDVVRDMLGPQLIEVLDELVMLSLSSAPVDELIATIAEHSGGFILASAQSSFTGLSVVELVEERLGFTARPVDTLRQDLIDVLGRFAVELQGGVSRELVGQLSAAVEQVFQRSLGEPDEGSDVGLAVALLVGALVGQVVLGRTLEPELIADAVDFVVEGVV